MYVFLATLHQPWSLVFLKPEFVAPKGLLVDLHRKKPGNHTGLSTYVLI